MAKFKAGDMIISIDPEYCSVLMVNRIIDDKYYSLDNGSGFIDARDTIANIDNNYQLCD